MFKGLKQRLMNGRESENADIDLSATSTFEVQIYTDGGRLISEYTLNQAHDNICTITAAERSARKNLANSFLEPLVLIISEYTLTKLRQIQVKVVNNLAGPMPT